MAMFLLRYRRQQRFGPWIDQIGPPDPDNCPDPAGRLDWHLGEIEEYGPDDDKDDDEEQAEPPEADGASSDEDGGQNLNLPAR